MLVTTKKNFNYKPNTTLNCDWARIAQSVQRLAPVWKVPGYIPGGGEIFRARAERT